VFAQYVIPLRCRPLLTELLKDLDVHKVINEFDRELEGFQVEAQNAFNQALDADQPGSVFRGKLTPYLVNYSRLVLFSFGFQKTYQHQESVAHDDEFLHKVGSLASIRSRSDLAVVPGGVHHSP
jgi:hypothetical protein